MNKFLGNCKANSIFNHVAFNGGKYFIGNEKKNEFYELYCKSYNSGEYLYLIESCLYPCVFFIDIDKKIELLDILKYFPNQDSIICKCTETDGIHIIFTNLIINNYENIECIPNELKSLIDMSVYKTGLRMIGSRKLNSNRVYLPIFKYNGCEKISEFSMLTPELLKSCSIQTPESSCNPSQSRIKNATLKSEYSDYSFFQKLHENYKSCQIKKVTKMNDKIYYIQTDSKFCLNKNDFHKNNFIYFVMKKNAKDNWEIRQKCYCKCNIERNNGMCKNFISQGIILSLNEINEIKIKS